MLVIAHRLTGKKMSQIKIWVFDKRRIFHLNCIFRLLLVKGQNGDIFLLKYVEKTVINVSEIFFSELILA